MVKEGLKVGADITNAVEFRQRANDYRQYAQNRPHDFHGLFYRRVAKEYENMAEQLYMLDRVLTDLHCEDGWFEPIASATTQRERLQNFISLIAAQTGETLSTQGVLDLAYDMAEAFVTDEMTPEDILRLGIPQIFFNYGIMVEAEWLNE